MNTIEQEVVSSDDLLYALQQQNLVYNHHFLNFSNQVREYDGIKYNHPDGWIYEDTGKEGCITYNESDNCCRIFKSPGNNGMFFCQALNEFPRWEKVLLGKTVTATAILSSPEETELTFSLDDGIGGNSSTQVRLQPNEQVSVSVRIKLGKQAATLLLSIESKTPAAVIDIYAVFANVGKLALENLPCTVQGIIGERKQYVSTETPPVTELSLCLGNTSVELTESQTRLDSILNGRFGRGRNGRSLLPNMSGYFSRAWNNSSNVDPDAFYRLSLRGNISGDHPGTIEKDELKSHSHDLRFSTAKTAQGGNQDPLIIINASRFSNTEMEGGKETRPVNIAELYTIKWA